MLKSQFKRALIISNSLLLVTAPAISHKNYAGSGTFAVDVIEMNPSLEEKQKVVLNKNVRHFVKTYIRRNNETLYRIKQRSKSPFLIMDSVLIKYNLPVELKYLAVVESELKTKAVSRVGAVGPWQLMPKTARIFGLKTGHSNDERMQYEKSTKAAARYLKDLYTVYGDWLLVLAAYNSGPGPVNQAIRKSGSRNFYKLQNYLPAESRGHVKKYIATHYYFEGRGGVTTLTKSERIEYKKAMDLLLAQQTAVIEAAGVARRLASANKTATAVTTK
jgi:membrane-bound lytic murein transglycosylase D